MQTHDAIGESDILPEICELTFRIERVLTVLKNETDTGAKPKPHLVIQQATANLEGWLETSFNLVYLTALDTLDSHEKEHVTILLRCMVHICDRLEASIY